MSKNARFATDGREEKVKLTDMEKQENRFDRLVEKKFGKANRDIIKARREFDGKNKRK